MRRALALVLAGSAFGLVQERLDPFAMERLLEPAPFLYLSLPQSEAAGADYATSAVRRFWENDEIKAFRAPIEAWWAKRKTQGARPGSPSLNEIVREQTGLTIDELWTLFSGPLTVAVYDLPMAPNRDLDLVVALGSPDAAGLKKLSDRAKDFLQQRGGLRAGQFDHQGKTIYELANDQLRLFYAFVEGHLVVTTSQARVEKIATAAARKAPALRDDADFKAARARVAPDARHLFHLHVNTAALFKAFRREIGDEGFKVMEALGVVDIRSLDVALAYDGGFLRERYALGTSRQDRGLLKYLAGKASADPAAAKVPAGALVYAHAAIEPVALYDAIAEATKADPDAEAAFKETIKEFEAGAGIDVRAALGSLGSSWTAYTVYPAGGGLMPYELASLELKDPELFLQSVRQLAKVFEKRIDAMEFRGKTIEVTSIPLFPGMEQLDGLDAWAFSFAYPLAWTLEGKTLLLSTNPLSIKRHLAAGAPARPIGQDPRFAALAARVPAGQWEAWVYADLGRALAAVYTTVEPLFHSMRDFPRDPESGELIVDLARLPLGETLSDLAGPSLTHKRTLPDGLLIESWSNLGVSYSGVVGIFAGLGASVPYFMMRRMEAAEPEGPAANELIAQLSLQLIRQAQETFKNSDSDRNNTADYWTRDLAGLYGLKDGSGQNLFLIDPRTAGADPDGAARYGLAPAPKNGYFFKAMSTDPDGQPYQADADNDGSAFTHKTRYALSAWPAQYGPGGRLTFIVSEAGKVWKKDTQGRPVDRWPGKDPAEDGWEPAD